LKLIPLHFADRLAVVNPEGTIGIVTLWSRVDYVLRLLRESSMDVSPDTSPIAALGTLYGNGLRELLRNLLYNPQIDTLIVLGRNRSGSAEELEAFFRRGLEPHPSDGIVYEAKEGCPAPTAMRIGGTSRVIDSMVRPEHFARRLRIVSAGNPQEAESVSKLRTFLASYTPMEGPIPDRMEIDLPQVKVSWHPSSPRQHSIHESDPLTAWKQLVFRLHRFGVPVRPAKGERRELQGVKVVVEEPGEVDAEQLRTYGFSESQIRRYQQDILSGALNADETYSYGNRLRTHFGVDSLDEAVRRLSLDPEDRKSYVVLWDPRRDLTASTGHPCLVSLFFRRMNDKLTLTATFRTHNALDAWLINFHGLMAIQRYVGSGCGMETGAITVFSHSITIDTAQMDRAAHIAAQSEVRYNEDPFGYFRITLDGDAILVEHRSGDVTLGTYRHAKASHIQYEICRDCAVSDISHAIYLGRQLARAEACLGDGSEFVQE
jgi:thymidylate synthase